MRNFAEKKTTNLNFNSIQRKKSNDASSFNKEKYQQDIGVEKKLASLSYSFSQRLPAPPPKKTPFEKNFPELQDGVKRAATFSSSAKQAKQQDYKDYSDNYFASYGGAGAGGNSTTKDGPSSNEARLMPSEAQSGFNRQPQESDNLLHNYTKTNNIFANKPSDAATSNLLNSVIPTGNRDTYIPGAGPSGRSIESTLAREREDSLKRPSLKNDTQSIWKANGSNGSKPGLHMKNSSSLFEDDESALANFKNKANMNMYSKLIPVTTVLPRDTKKGRSKNNQSSSSSSVFSNPGNHDIYDGNAVVTVNPAIPRKEPFGTIKASPTRQSYVSHSLQSAVHEAQKKQELSPQKVIQSLQNPSKGPVREPHANNALSMKMGKKPGATSLHSNHSMADKQKTSMVSSLKGKISQDVVNENGIDGLKKHVVLSTSSTKTSLTWKQLAALTPETSIALENVHIEEYTEEMEEQEAQDGAGTQKGHNEENIDHRIEENTREARLPALDTEREKIPSTNTASYKLSAHGAEAISKQTEDAALHSYKEDGRIKPVNTDRITRDDFMKDTWSFHYKKGPDVRTGHNSSGRNGQIYNGHKSANIYKNNYNHDFMGNNKTKGISKTNIKHSPPLVMNSRAQAFKEAVLDSKQPRSNQGHERNPQESGESIAFAVETSTLIGNASQPIIINSLNDNSEVGSHPLHKVEGVQYHGSEWVTVDSAEEVRNYGLTKATAYGTPSGDSVDADGLFEAAALVAGFALEDSDSWQHMSEWREGITITTSNVREVRAHRGLCTDVSSEWAPLMEHARKNETDLHERDRNVWG